MDEQTKILAEQLSAIHGMVTVSTGRSGVHLRFASPRCLETDGARELSPGARHLYLNVDKYLCRGKFRSMRGTYDADLCARCHKTNTAYRVSALLAMHPVEARPGLDLSQVDMRREVNGDDKDDALRLRNDEGRVIAWPPGECVDVRTLEASHPARVYLDNRDGGPFDLDVLNGMFRLEYCVKQAPPDRSIKRYYKRLALGFRNTPQGRLIIHSVVNGARVGWQARVLQQDIGNTRFYWHPYRECWVPAEILVPNSKPRVTEEVARDEYPWEMAKYFIGNLQLKSTFLLGYDAAVEWMKTRNCPVMGLVEGPLDAGRPGPPFVAMMGKTLSQAQAALLAAAGVRKVVYVKDANKYGEEAWKQVNSILDRSVARVALSVPEGNDDLGSMSPEKALELVTPHLRL
jgi:hypothetical protein